MHPWCRCHFNPAVDDWDEWLDDYEQRHANAGNHLQDIFKDDKIKSTRISQQVYERLSSPEIDELTKAQNAALRKGMENLLKRVDGTPEGTECAYYYDMYAKFLKWEMGEPGKGRIGVYNPHIDYIAMHNHPSGGTFSIGDINSFVENNNMKILIVVGNNGNQYILKKTNNFAGEQFIKEYRNYLVQLSKQADNISEFLNGANQFLITNGKKYGYEYKENFS